jgi:hypothetical protein
MTPTINAQEADNLRDDIKRLQDDLDGIDMYVGMGGMTVNARDRIKAGIEQLNEALNDIQED